MSETSNANDLADFRDLYDNAPCGYLVLSADGRITRVNATLCRWTGYVSTDMIGKRVHQFLDMAGRIYYETHVAPLLRMQGFFNEFALNLLSQTGDQLPVIANAAEQRSADNILLSTRLVVIKATDRRRYERELLAARASATATLQSERETAQLREQFIAVLGHDLRNPLAAISAGTRILQRSAVLRDSPKELRVLDMVSSTVARMSDLIDNILDFARGRLGGGFAINRDATQPIAPTLIQVVDELRTATGRSIETDFAVARLVPCDGARIAQMVSNLVGNALTHGAADKPVRVGAKTDENSFSIWVSNEGNPIPEEAMSRLFEPFFRGDIRDSRQGLGLGLHIASQIANAHGGSLTVTSTPEETRFVFKMALVT